MLKTIQRLRLVALALACAFISAGLAHAQVPALLPVQGYLTNEEGALVPDGSYDVRFRLYETAEPTDTAAVHDEIIAIDVVGGYFTAYLGDTDAGGEALDLGLFSDSTELFLGIKVGSDAEAVPRLQIGSTAFSAVAGYCGDAETLGGQAAEEFAAADHSHGYSDLSGVAAASHEHAIGDLNGVAAATHTHGYSDLSGVASSSHSHSLADLSGTAANATHATTADELSGGANGSIPYQTGAGATSMLAAGTSGQVLSSNGAAAPSWITPTSANTASTIVYRNASGNFSAGTITATLSGNATSATTATSATSATTADELSGGANGSIPYQTGAGATSMLAAGSSGALLRSAGAAAPTWFNGVTDGILYYDGGWTSSSTFVNNGGWIGVGTANPNGNLHVYDSATATIRVEGRVSNLGSAASELVMVTPNYRRAAGMRVYTESGEAQWWIGRAYDPNDRGEFVIGYADSSFSSPAYPEHISRSVFQLDPNGDLWIEGVLTHDSDERLKKNIKPIESALESMTRLEGVTFEWKKPEEHGDQYGPRMGMIAQQIETVFPNWVSTDKDGSKRVSYVGFEGLAVEAMRELKTKHDALSEQNAKLEASNKALAERLARLERLVAQRDGKAIGSR